MCVLEKWVHLNPILLRRISKSLKMWKSGKKWKRLSDERGWADVSYFSEIQRGCPVGSLPRPLLWNALTHSRRVKRIDSKLARQQENMCDTEIVFTLDTLILDQWITMSGFASFIQYPYKNIRISGYVLLILFQNYFFHFILLISADVPGVCSNISLLITCQTVI